MLHVSTSHVGRNHPEKGPAAGAGAGAGSVVTASLKGKGRRVVRG
jgi:hypothetical protein